MKYLTNIAGIVPIPSKLKKTDEPTILRSGKKRPWWLASPSWVKLQSQWLILSVRDAIAT